MKRYYNIFLSLALLVGILGSGVGIPLLVHTCNISGEKSVSLVADGGCHPKTAATGTTLEKDDCCSFQARYAQLSTVSSKPQHWESGFIFLPVVLLLAGAIFPKLFAAPPAALPYSPLLLSGGRDRLCHIHILRI